jgi:hypothetical protein
MRRSTNTAFFPAATSWVRIATTKVMARDASMIGDGIGKGLSFVVV